jgi:hypothetical protein
MTKEELYNIARQKHGTRFIGAVEAIARKLDTKPEWLLALMYHESRMNPAAVNSIGCVGLTQFCPITYRNKWHKDIEYFKRMSAINQLFWVNKYFQAWKNLAGSYDHPAKLFAVNFFPLMLKHWDNDNWVLQTSDLSAQKIASQNPGFDLNKDGRITVGEVKRYYETSPIFKDLMPTRPTNTASKKIILMAILVVAVLIGGFSMFLLLRN